MIVLRDYQTDAVLDLADAILDGERELALVSPTGSGKTVVLTALLATLKRHLVGAVVTVPSVQIEANYENTLVFDLAPQDAADLGVTVVGGQLDARGTYATIRALSAERRRSEFDSILAGVDKTLTPWAYTTTHAQLVEWGPEGLPADLTNRLLVVDEAHHAAAEATQIGEYAAAWRARGGTTLYLTATPYRADGHEVLSTTAHKHVHSIAKHAASGYAPRDFRVKTAALDVDVDEIEAWRGETLPEAEVTSGRGYEAVVSQWEADGRPKAVFIVPGNRDSRAWARRLIKALPEGVRVFDAVGAEPAKAAALQALLKRERGVRAFADSSVDVIVACRRFDEGTDWPLCSAVYCVGVPRSFGLVAQRWGRAFRSKAGIAGYPPEHAEVAQITFLLAKLTAKGLEKLKGDHHEYAMLLGVYLADHEIGRLVGRQWDRRDRPRGEGRLARVRKEQSEALDDRRSAEVQLRLVRWAAQFEEEQNRAPTPEEWGSEIDSIADKAERRAAARVVSRWLAAGVDEDDRRRLAGMMAGAGINPAYRELFREAIQGVGATAVDVVGMVARVVSAFTGEDATGVVERIRARRRQLGWTTTESEVRAAASRWAELHGDLPNRRTRGDVREVWADIPEGVSATWVAVNSWLVHGLHGLSGGSSLARLCGAAGEWSTTEDEIRAVAFRWKDRYGELPKQLTAGDPREVWPEVPDHIAVSSWKNINQWLHVGSHGLPGGSSLPVLLEVPLTAEAIVHACRQWRAAYGQWPSQGTVGDVRSVWDGYYKPYRKWSSVDDALRTGLRGLPGGSSLSKLRQIEDNEAIPVEPWVVTEDEIRRAAACHKDERGFWPTPSTSGFLREFMPSVPSSVKDTWKNVDAWLSRGCHGLPGNSNLHKLGDTSTNRRGYLRDLLKSIGPSGLRAAVENHKRRTGKWPGTMTKGDAAEDFGVVYPNPVTWNGVSQAVKAVYGVTLHQWLVQEGLK